MAASGNLFSELDKLLASQEPSSTPQATIQSLGTPSASIAVLTADGIVSHAISSDASPADPDTLYQACSISKTICGLAILRTIDQGKLSHDDPVTKHLPPEYIDAISTPRTRKLLEHLTVRHLVSHTGGVTVSGFPGYDCNGSVPSTKTILEGSAGSNTPQIRLSRFPGLKWRYAGGGTTIDQVILETIHGKAYPELVKELVFEPLDMTRSFYSLADGEKNFAQCYSTGVTETAPARYHIQPELGAAGLWTTPTDLLKAQRGIRDAALGRNDFLSKDLAQLGLTAIEGANGFTYGCWQRQKTWFGHGGSNNPGFRCQNVCFYDEGKGRLGKAENEGIAVMTNSALGTEVYLKIIHAVGYLRGWKGARSEGWLGREDTVVPLMDRNAELDGGWREWKGNWELKIGDEEDEIRNDQIVALDEDKQGKPTFALGDLPSMDLVKAATPAIAYDNEKGEGMELAVDGLDMAVSLGFDGQGERQLRIWPGFWEESIDCRRTSQI